MNIDTRLVHGGLRAAVALAAAAALIQGVQSTGWSADLSGAAAAGQTPGQTFVADASLSCAGPEMSGIEGVTDMRGTVDVTAAAAPEQAWSGTAPTGPGTLSASAIGAAATGSDDARSVTTTLSGTDAGLVHGTGALAPGLAASQEWAVANDVVRGLVSAPCGPPSSDAWLLAGAGQPGRQERLILTNPGANQVTANVTLHGAKGQVHSATGQGIVVPARGRTAILLDAIAASETHPVVHVVTTGGSVHATLNDFWLDGSVPAGVDDTVAAAAPATTQVIPGVAVIDSSQGATSVRIAVPGATAAVVQLRLLTRDGATPLPAGGVQTVQPGAVVDVALTGVRPDIYAVEVTADVPVVAAASFSRRTGRGVGDFAWMPASQTLTGLAGAVFAQSTGRQRLLVLAATDTPATVDLLQVDEDGAVEVESLTVDADSAAWVQLTGASVWVRPSGGGTLHAGMLTYAGEGSNQFVTAAPINPTQVHATLSRVLSAP